MFALRTSVGWRRIFGLLPRPAGDLLLGDLAHGFFDWNALGLIRRCAKLESRLPLLRETSQIRSGILLEPWLRIIGQRKAQALILTRLGEQPEDGERQRDDRSRDEACARPEERTRHVACFMSRRIEASFPHVRSPLDVTASVVADMPTSAAM
jgi:hypothetical protein